VQQTAEFGVFGENLLMLKIAWRNLLKTKSFNLLNVAGLAIGIACAGLIFLWAEDEYRFDDAHLNKDQLYAVRVIGNYAGYTYVNPSTPRAMAKALKTDIPGIVNTCRTSDEPEKALINIDGKPVYSMGLYADTSLFSMFTLPFVQGNATSAFAHLYTLVITESAARKFFGEEKDIIGRTVRFNNEENYTITGIVKDPPRNSSLQFEWLASYESSLRHHQAIYGNSDQYNWGAYGPLTYIELGAASNPSLVNKQLYDYIHQKDATQHTHPFLFPMSKWRLYDQFENGKPTGSGRIRQVHLLSVIAWIILFIACINFMNLTTARSEKRAREVGVRKVLGAQRGALIAQFIGESVLLSSFGAIVALALMALFLPAFNTLVQKELSLDVLAPEHLVALLLIILVCGLVAGSYPSLYLSSFRPVMVLKGIKISTGNAATIRKGLVVLQFTVSVIFIMSTIIIYRQLQHARNRDLGFNKEQLLEIDMQHAIPGKFASIRQDLMNTGLVENVALAGHAIVLGGDLTDRFTWEGKAVDSKLSMATREVSPEFIHTSGMHLIDGQDFASPADSGSVIITRSMADQMGEGSPVGKIIQSTNEDQKSGNRIFIVKGVVDDYVYGNIYGQPGPVLFFCKPPRWANLVYVRLKKHPDPEQVLIKISAVIKKDNPEYPFDYKFVDNQLNRLFLPELLMGKLSTVFAALAIVISCLGLFGLAAYTAERRTKEMAIRKVLGSSAARIAGLLSKEFLQLVLLSCFIAFPVAAWMMHDWLQQYQYRIGMSPWLFVLAAGIALFIALVTISLQTIKAARSNPIKNLRAE
jgi:predicted permease